MNHIEENSAAGQSSSSTAADPKVKSRRQRAKSPALARAVSADFAQAAERKQPRARNNEQVMQQPNLEHGETTAAKKTDTPRGDKHNNQSPAQMDSSDEPRAKPPAAHESQGMLSSIRRAMNTLMSRSDSHRAPSAELEPPIPGGDTSPAPTPSIGKPNQKTPPEQSPANVSLEKTANIPFAIPQPLKNRYYISDDKYYFRDRQQALAFEDRGHRIATQHDDAKVAHSMVELAVAKGWQGIKIKGSEPFKREAWLAAAARGIETTGYRPKKVDRERLADIMAERQTQGQSREHGRNSVERKPIDPQKESRAVTPPQTDSSDGKHQEQEKTSRQQPRLPAHQLKAIDALKNLMQQRGDSPEAIKLTAQLARETLQQRRSHVGRIVKHGPAPYKHDMDEQDSYYVVLATPQGEKTVWGIDLKRQFGKTPMAIGTDVVVSQVGQRGVTVQANERDENHQVTGKTIPLDTVKNKWEVSSIDDMRRKATGKSERAPERPSPTPPVPTPTPRPPKAHRTNREKTTPLREMPSR